MLVKFNNDDKGFIKKIEQLKSDFGVGSASKVAQVTINNFSQLDYDYHIALDKIEELENELENIKNLIREKNSIAQRLIDMVEL